MSLEEIVRRLVQLYIRNLRVFTKLVKERDNFYVLNMNLPILMWCTEDGKLIESSVISGSMNSVGIGLHVDDRCDDTLLRVIIWNRLPLTILGTPSETDKPRCIYIITNIKERVVNIIEKLSEGRIKCEDAGEHMLKCCVVAGKHES